MQRWLSIFARPVRHLGVGRFPGTMDVPDFLRSREDVVKYMLLILGGADWADSMTEEQVAAGMAAHGSFAAFLQSRGLPFEGEALLAPRTAKTVRRDGDELLVTDGPFVDVKEGIGGYYIVEAADLDEAIDVAKRCPTSLAVEVRPVYATD